jgi:hypothetical protein
VDSAREFRVAAAAGADVARDVGGADRAPRRVADGRDADRDLDARAVLVQAHGLQVAHLLAAAQGGLDLRELRVQVFGDDGRDVLAQDLLGLVAVEPLGRRVEARDDAFERLRDDGVL